MNKRKYNTDPEMLLQQGKAIMSSSNESRYHFRVFAVNMVLSGCSASQIGAMAGVSKVAVTGWVKIADELQSLRRNNSKRLMVFFSQIRKITVTKTGMDRHFLPISRPSITSVSVSDSARDYFITLVFLIYALSLIHQKDMKIPRSAMSLKKTLRNRSRRHRHFSLSRRSSFSDTNNHHLRVV